MFLYMNYFTGEVAGLMANPPTSKASVFLWIITFDLSGMRDPTSSYATGGKLSGSFDHADLMTVLKYCTGGGF